MTDRRHINNHAPGPWKRHKNLVRDARGAFLVSTENCYSDDEMEASATLIAAAPEMLTALECIAEHSLKNTPSKWNDELQDFVSIAIAIAKGKK